jgi:hypothetical protein
LAIGPIFSPVQDRADYQSAAGYQPPPHHQTNRGKATLCFNRADLGFFSKPV